MDGCLFHVFRNTPLGREVLLQSIYFCTMLDLCLCIYVPESNRFLMQLDNDIIPVDLDQSYLTSPETAVSNSTELVERHQVKCEWINAERYAKSTFPCIRNTFDFMCCSRSIQNGSAKIRLGHIGSKVRRILSTAPFPLLISSPVYKPWHSITAFFEDWDTSGDVLQLGLRLSQTSGLPMDIFTSKEGNGDRPPKSGLQAIDVREDLAKLRCTWHQYDTQNFVENLYKVSHEALVVVKCSGKRGIREYSSTMEKIQSTIPNNLLIVGPKYRPRSKMESCFFK